MRVIFYVARMTFGGTKKAQPRPQCFFSFDVSMEVKRREKRSSGDKVKIIK